MTLEEFVIVSRGAFESGQRALDRESEPFGHVAPLIRFMAAQSLLAQARQDIEQSAIPDDIKRAAKVFVEQADEHFRRGRGQ